MVMIMIYFLEVLKSFINSTYNKFYDITLQIASIFLIKFTRVNSHFPNPRVSSLVLKYRSSSHFLLDLRDVIS